MSELDQVRPILEAWRTDDSIVSLEPLTPDASTRRYYRATFASNASNRPKTVVAVFYDSVASPEYEGAVKVSVDRAYVELTELLRSHSIAVPELYLDAGDSGVLLIEDLGDRQLADVVADPQQRIAAKRYFENAIEQLVRLQQIPEDRNFFAFQRSFSAQAYYNEMREFQDYLLQPFELPANQHSIVDRYMQTLAQQLDSLPKVLTHRDYHGWNLLIDPADQLRVIDFQDALMAPISYDLVGLLNDRDMDTLLGKENYQYFLKQFFEAIKAPGDFYQVYDRVLLQRDFKVAGRFAKLSSEKGLLRYKAWIPGTLRRIGRTLSRAAKTGKDQVTLELAALLEVHFTEIAEGLKEEAWY